MHVLLFEKKKLSSRGSGSRHFEREEGGGIAQLRIGYCGGVEQASRARFMRRGGETHFLPEVFELW